jgi:hypothetical protein
VLIFDAETLKADTVAMEAYKIDEADGAITMKKKNDFDKETGRRLQASRMFTDGQFFYTLSTRKYIAPKDVDEDAESLPMATVLEQYNPLDNFKHMRSVTLVKNEKGEHWINKEKKGDTKSYDE